MKTDSVLELINVGKKYARHATPRERFWSLLWGDIMHDAQWVLQDVSFALERGQCMGVVGNNGAGKSSLLKLIAGTLAPSEGSIRCNGRITAILELGAGFHPDFSGRENLRFGGRLIGISEQDIARLEDDIIAFSELQEAIDRPVKSYSSGMVVRLAFALITAVEPDVLIIDEALAVGDQHFQKRCIERIEQFRRNGCTILFCSHSLYHVRHLCNRALWLDKGKVRNFGDTDSVISDYEAHIRLQELAPGTVPGVPTTQKSEYPPVQDIQEASIRQASVLPGHASLLSVSIDHLEQGAPPILNAADLVIRIRASATDEQPSIGIMLEQYQGPGITSVATHADRAAPTRDADGNWASTLTFPNLPLHSGDYVLSAYLFNSNGMVVCDQWLHFQAFKWNSPSLTPGLVRLPHFWR